MPFLVSAASLQPGPRAPLPERLHCNAIFLRPGFLTGLRALSVCSWVPTASGHLGTLLSYATEENDNKLVLHGRDSLVPGSMHFVIGDPDFRELPLQPLLDGRWHHTPDLWLVGKAGIDRTGVAHSAFQCDVMDPCRAQNQRVWLFVSTFSSLS